MRGGLLFYEPTDPWMWVIAHATGGPFAHVAIDLGDGTVIEALNNGVQHDYASPHGHPWAPPATADVDKGLAWLQQELHLPYGWGDIIEDAEKVLGNPHPETIDPRHYDCSDLATRFLIACGVDVGHCAYDPHTVSPNDLARQLGVIPHVRTA